MIKRFVMFVAGLILVLGGVTVMVSNPNFVIDLLLGGAAATGAGLMFKALVGEKE